MNKELLQRKNQQNELSLSELQSKHALQIKFWIITLFVSGYFELTYLNLLTCVIVFLSLKKRPLNLHSRFWPQNFGVFLAEINRKAMFFSSVLVYHNYFFVWFNRISSAIFQSFKAYFSVVNPSEVNR